jgi:hypothetical protein
LSDNSNSYFQHNNSPRELESDAPSTNRRRPTEAPQSPVDRVQFELDYNNYYKPDLPGLEDDCFHFEPDPWQSVTPQSSVSSSSGLGARVPSPSHDQHLFQLEHSPPPSPGISAQDSHNDRSSRRTESPPGDDRPVSTTQFRRIYHPTINGA